LVHGALFKAEKNAYGYKVFIDLHPESTPVAPKVTPNVEKQATPVAKVAANPVPIAPKAAPEKPAKKASQPTSVPLPPTNMPTAAKPTTLKKEAGHRKAVAPKKTVVVPSAPAGTGKGATLIVAVPSDEGKREFIERKSRRAAESSEAIHTVRPNGGAKPTKKPVSSLHKPLQPKPSKPTITKSGKKKVAKPVQSMKAPIKPQGKPVKLQAIEPVKTLLEEAQAAEKRLMANYNNPNYPKGHKQKDLEAQIDRVSQLQSADVTKLRYSVAKLKELAAKL
jgi:hypothetical protein